jgi:catechol 2,3-dioxygenase
LRHVLAAEIVLNGAAEHDVSEVLYLTDLEGNGVGLHRDRHQSEWRRSGGRGLGLFTPSPNLDGLLREDHSV